MNGEIKCLSTNKIHRTTNRINVQTFKYSHNLIKIIKTIKKKELKRKILKYFMIAFRSYFIKKITFKFFYKLQWTLLNTFWKNMII